MSLQNTQPAPDQSSDLYSARDAMWADLQRTGSLIVPIFFGLFVAMIYVIIYVYVINNADPKIWDLGWILSPVILFFVLHFWASHAATDFFNAFYLPPEDTDSSSLISLRLRGVLPLPKLLASLMKSHYPFVLINIKDVTDGKFKLEEQPVCWLGGPALLVVMDGAGLYLQRGHQFSRTLGPGIHFLDRFETVQDIVDLRPQTLRSDRPIQGRTKDGIKIKFNVEITFHIIRADLKKKKVESPGKGQLKKTQAEKDAEELYLVNTTVDSGDLGAIRKAAERTTVRCTKINGERKYSQAKWRDGIWGTISGDLAKYITKHYLDELLIFEEGLETIRLADSTYSAPQAAAQNGSIPQAGQLLSGQERERLRAEFNATLQKTSGVMLTGLRIVDFDIPREVYEQRLLMVDAERSSHIRRIQGRATAENILTREKARTQGQQDLIASFADNLDGIDPANITDSILLSLSGILSQSMDDPMLSANMARDTFETLKQLRDFLNRKEQSNDTGLIRR